MCWPGHEVAVLRRRLATQEHGRGRSPLAHSPSPFHLNLIIFHVFG